MASQRHLSCEACGSPNCRSTERGSLCAPARDQSRGRWRLKDISSDLFRSCWSWELRFRTRCAHKAPWPQRSLTLIKPRQQLGGPPTALTTSPIYMKWFASLRCRRRDLGNLRTKRHHLCRSERCRLVRIGIRSPRRCSITFTGWVVGAVLLAFPREEAETPRGR